MFSIISDHRLLSLRLLRWLNTALFARALVLMRVSARTKIAKINKHGTVKATIYLFYNCSICLFLLKITHVVIGFSPLLELYIRKFQDAKKSRIFALAVRTQLNAVQLNKKLGMDDFFTISTFL